VRELVLGGRKATVVTPAGASGPFPFAVLLHGLGETTDPKAGAWAWVERYGLATSYARLRHPPVLAERARGDFTVEAQREVNALLGARPLRPLAFVCPSMPNIQTTPEARVYGDWIVKELLPAARAAAPLDAEPRRAVLGGCSLGSFVALEAFLTHPEAFGGFAGVQTAIFETSAAGYAARAAEVIKGGARDFYLATSTLDHYRKSTDALALELSRQLVMYTYRLSAGPHDQPWLREVGSLEMVLWLDRRLPS
jgi:pimeloyl-ACP methyl ester carboxylesterase